MENQRTMRRKEQQLQEKEAWDILRRGTYGILSTVAADGQTSGTPLSYEVLQDKIYFHCAHEGLKIDNIKGQPKVCFTVVGPVQALFNGGFTTLYESAMVYGLARKVQEDAEKTTALLAICQKYLPENIEKAPAYISGALAATAVYSVQVDVITGKAQRQKSKPD